MVASNPNPIAIFASGNRSRGYGAVINASANDADGSDAVQIYQLDSGAFALLRRIQIYSRGTSNGGAGVKAHIWFSYDGGSTKDCLKTVTFAGNVRGIVAEIDMDDITPPTDANPSPQQGFLMGSLENSEILYIQIEDGSISDGYRVLPVLRDYSQKSDLNNQD